MNDDVDGDNTIVEATEMKIERNGNSCTDAANGHTQTQSFKFALEDEKVKANESENSDFDPYQYGNEKNATSFWSTVMHMIIVSISPTLLNLPAAFQTIGWLIGTVGSFVIVLLYAYCMHMVVKNEYSLCKRLRRPNMTYTELVYQAFRAGPASVRWMAPHMRRLVYADFVCMWSGGNAIYVMLICENVKFVLARTALLTVADRVVMLYLVVPITLLCWIPNLKLLVACSIFSNTVNACSLLIIVWSVLHNLPDPSSRTMIGDFLTAPYFLGIILVTVNGTGLLMSLKNQMKDPRRFRSKFGVLNVSYVPTGILYAAFGFVCYVQYGERTAENVIMNLPEDAFGVTVRGLYAMSVLCFYPLCSFVAFDLICNEMWRGKFKRNRYGCVYRCVIRTMNGAGPVALAYIIPNLHLFITITGTVCASFDSIILPAAVDMLVKYDDNSSTRANFAKNTALILFGILLTIAGLWDACMKVVQYYE